MFSSKTVKELKKFSKVNILSGKTVDVTFTIDEDDFKFYDDRKSEWVVEPGKFKLYIGSSSVSVPVQININYK